MGGAERHATGSEAETERLAAELAGSLRAGDVVLVVGELGAGKTTFVRGACRDLEVTERVSSPTFAIGQRYAGRLPVSHLDLYRLESLQEEEPGLIDDYLTPDAVAFVESPEVARTQGWIGAVAATVRIEHAGGDRRRIEIER